MDYLPGTVKIAENCLPLSQKPPIVNIATAKGGIVCPTLISMLRCDWIQNFLMLSQPL